MEDFQVKGRQVPIHDIKGGMRSDKDPRRIPNNAWQKIINAEYTRLGYLEKSKGFDYFDFASIGMVRDLKTINDENSILRGYLIAEDRLRFANDLLSNATVDEKFERAVSKVFGEPSGRYFYISDDGSGVRTLRKWYYSSPHGEDVPAGVPAIPLKPQVEDFASAANPVLETCFDSGNNDDTIKIELQNTIPNYIIFRSGKGHPTLKLGATFNKIYIPIKALTFGAASRTLTIGVNEISPAGSIKSESSGITVNNTDTLITYNLTNTYNLLDENNYIQITIYPGGNWDGDNITFYRAKPWFIHSEATGDEGSIRVNAPDFGGDITYTDREMVVGFEITNALLVSGDFQGIYQAEDNLGRVGSFDSDIYIQTITKLVDRVLLFQIPPAFTTADPFGYLNSLGNASLESVTYGRTMDGGGTFYKIITLPITVADTYKGYRDIDATLWTGSGLTPLQPYQLLDCNVLGEEMESINDDPIGLSPLEDTIVEWRSRLWIISRVVDINGVYRTYLRYSEVDNYDYWDPLNEIGIPDTLIGICPLREDMFLTFSKSKVYRVVPSGTGFEWLKIADIGLGSPRLVVSTFEAIFWINEFGMYTFDGSAVTLVLLSQEILSYIQKMVEANGIMGTINKGQKIWISGTFDGSNFMILGDMLIKAVTMRSTEKKITCVFEDDYETIFGMESAIARKSLGYRDGDEIVSTALKSKRFSSNDLNRIVLYYIGMTHKIEASGSLAFTFTFSTGKEVTKTLDLSGVLTKDIKFSQFEVYGEGEWFEFEIIHATDEAFQINDYVVGALPIDLQFDEGGSNA